MESFQNVSERHVSVTSGHPAILDLPSIDSMPAPSVTWQTSDGPLKYDIKYAFTKSNQLIILSTNEMDRNAYRASAFNTQLGKEEKSAFIHLNVTGDPYVEIAPEIIVHPQDMKIRRGEQLTELQCIANSRPLHELETLWLKDGIPIENTGISFRLRDQWNRSLALLSANMTHAGVYTCQVRLRTGGYEMVKSTAKVEILEPPSFITAMRTETFGEFGELVTLSCDVIGDPVPKVQWYKNSEPIDFRNGKYSIGEDNSFHIKKLALDDSAMYQCLASNEAGEKSAYTWLRVKTTKLLHAVDSTNIHENNIIASTANSTFNTHNHSHNLFNDFNNNNNNNNGGHVDVFINASAKEAKNKDFKSNLQQKLTNTNSYVFNLLKRLKRLAQPRILRSRGSHTGGIITGSRRKDYRFGMGVL